MRLPSIIAAIVAAFFLSGCTPAVMNPTQEQEDIPTVEDIFSAPANTAAPGSAPSTEVTDQADETAPPLPVGSFGGSLSAGPNQVSQDEKGAYMTYEGGEMEIPFHIDATGSVRQKEIGLLLFIDGQSQPYRTEKDGCEYFHIFRVPESGRCDITVCFTPVTGKQGDELELYALPLLDPLRTLDENGMGPSITSTPLASFRLKYNATPPAASQPVKQLRLQEAAMTYANTTYAEIGSWSDTDLLERNESHLSVNGLDDRGHCTVYGADADTDIPLRFEVWGSPYVHYGLVFFVENRPVFPQDGMPFFIEVRSGQKTVVETTLSMAEFDGECPVYAVLVPRNYRSCEVLTVCSLSASRIFFLTGQVKPR